MKHFKNISLSSIMEKLTVILLVISFFYEHQRTSFSTSIN